MEQSFTLSKKIVRDFMNKTLGRPNTLDENVLRHSLAEILVYLDFLDIIYHRYNEAGLQYHKSIKMLEISIEGKSDTSGPEEEDYSGDWLTKNRQIGNQVRLEVESFHIFTHVLLNKMVNFPERYFLGNYRRGIKCGSHRQFWKTVRETEHFQPLSENLDCDIHWLQDNVIDHRDKLITHTLQKEHYQRMLVKGFVFSRGLRSISTTLYPDDRVKGQEISEDINQIINKLQSYIRNFFNFLENHFDKSIITS